MITDDDLRFAIDIAKGETECVASRALKILHERHGMMEVHEHDAAERLRDMFVQEYLNADEE